MQHSFRRILSLVLTFAMVLSCVPAQVFAAEVCEHSYDVTVTGAGCTEEGSAVYTCSVCGDTYMEAIAAAGHDYQETERVEAVCGEAGSVTYTCSACGDSYAEELPAPGEHSYAEGVCTVCSAADPDAVPEEEPTEEPTEAPTEATEVPEVIVEDFLVTDEENTTTTEATEGPDGGDIPVTDDPVNVAQLGTDGATYVYLEAAIEAAAAISENRPAVYVLADCTVEETVQINTEITLIYAGEGTVPTITVEQANNSVFEVGAGGALVLENVTVKNNGEIVIQDEGSLEIRGTLEVASGGWLESHGTITVANGGKLEIQSGANMLNCGTFNNSGTFVNSGCVMDCTGDAFVEGGEYVKYDPLQLELFAAMDAKVDYALTRDYTLSGGNLSVHLNDQGQDKLFTVEGAKLIVPSGMELRIRSRAALQSGAELIVQPGGRLLIEGQLTVNESTWLESHGEIVITNGTLQVQANANMLNCGSVTNNGGQFVNNGCVMDCGNIKNTITSSAENSEYVKYDPLQMDLFAAMDAQTDYTLAEDHVLEGNLSVYLNDQGQDKQFTIDNAKLIIPSGMELRIRSRAVLQNAAEIIVEQGGRLWIDGGELTLAEGTWLESRGEICIENGGKLELQADSEMMNYGTITNNGEFINDGFIDDFVGIPSGTITGGSGQCRKFDTGLQLELFQAMGKNDYVLTRDYTLQGDMSIRLGGYEAEDGYEEYIFTLDNVTLTVPDGCIVYSHSPVMLKGNARILVEAGGTLIINNIIHVGRGTVHMYAGSTLYDNVGIFDLSHEGETDDYITAYHVNSDNGIYYEVVDQFGYIPSYSWRMEPGSQNPMIFYFNHWTGDRWARTPIAADEMTLTSGLTVEPIGAENAREDQINGDYFLRVSVSGDVDWDTKEMVTYNDISFDINVQRDHNWGFYSSPEPSNETWLRDVSFGPDMENSFFLICTNEDMTMKTVRAEVWEGPNKMSGGVIFMKYDHNIWKFQLTEDVVENMGRNIWMNVQVTLVDENGNEHHWDRGINCEPWVWNRGRPDASFGINGEWYKYYAKFDRFMKDVNDENGDYLYETDAVLPEGVHYDLGYNTLTLDGAELTDLDINFSWYDENRQESGTDLPNSNFKLNLKGDNYIRSNGDVPLRFHDHHGEGLTVTIGGSGSLYVENKNNFGYNGRVNAADVGNVDLVIADSANVTFHVEGQNQWDDGNDATMHALQGSNSSTLRICDSATLTMEVPEILNDETDDFNGRYRGLANFVDVIVEDQATVNLDLLELYYDGDTGVHQQFHQRGGNVNINARPSIVVDEETGASSYWYDPLNINDGSLLDISGGKLNITVDHRNAAPADCTMINVWQGTLQVSGGQLNLNANIPGSGICVDGSDEMQGYLYVTGGTLNDKSNGQDGAFLNIRYNGRATFAGGTISSDGGYTEFDGYSGEGQTPAILWTGTNFYGTGNVVDVEGNFKMTGGLFQLNEGRMEVKNSMVFTGGTMDMNDSAFVANGTANVEGVAKLDFDMTHQVEGGTPVEVGGTMTVGGNARIDIDIKLESITDENGEYIHFAGIHNFGNFVQNSGIVYINSNAKCENILSAGDLQLNSGEMTLKGIAGVGFFTDDEGKVIPYTLTMGDGMTLNVEASRVGLQITGDSWINGGNLNISVVQPEDKEAFGFYVLNGAVVEFNGGVHNISAQTVNGDYISTGIVVDYNNTEEYPELYINEGTALTVSAERPVSYWNLADNATPYIYIANRAPSWSTTQNLETMTFDYHLVCVDNQLQITADIATLQSILHTLGPDDWGYYKLAQAVVVNESMTLEDANGDPIKLQVIRGGKITVCSGATLTIPAGGELVAFNNREGTDHPDGAVIVEAGGVLVNNGVLANDGGRIVINSSTGGQGYVEGSNAVAVSHYANGKFTFIQGVDASCQELNANVADIQELKAVLNEAQQPYRYVYIWTPSSLNLSGLVIPENVGLDIDGQDATAQLTIDEGSTFQVLGGISLGNVNLVVNGTLKNSGEIHTDPNDNAQITINGTYTDAGQGKVFLNNANVTVNGKIIHNDGTSGMDINDRSVVTIAAGGVMSMHGNLGVGYWQMTPDASVTAGTLNIEGQVEIFNYMEAAPFGGETGGIVNIRNGGNLTIDIDPAKDAYGYLNIGGEVNVEAGGTLRNRNFVELTGELNVSGNLYNEVGEEYYGEIVLQDAENGNSGSLIASAGAIIDNDGGIGHYSSGELRVAAANFTSDAEDSAIYISWFGDRAATNDIAKSMAFLIYEGNDVNAANNMAAHASAEGYRNSIVTVVGEMVVDNNQRLVSDYVIVTQESELIVKGRMSALVRLNVRSGATLTITKSGAVYAAKEMNTFAADEAYGDSVVDNRGMLEFAPDAAAKIEGSYDDLGVGTLIRDAAFDDKNQLHIGQLTGNNGNLDMANITFSAEVSGENAEYKLIKAIDAVSDYDNGTIWIKTDVHVTEDLQIPETVTIRIAADGDNKGYLTLHNGVTLDNSGTVYADVSYAALNTSEGAQVYYAGSGVYRGFCGVGDNWVDMSWRLKNGNLTISGNGAVADYSDEAPAPWQNLGFSKVTLGADVTGIGSNAFAGCNASMVVPNTVTVFGENCFGDAMQLKVYHGSAAENYLKDTGYNQELVSEFHHMEDGHCTYDGCDYGLETLLSNENTATAQEKVEELKNIDAESLKQEMINSEKPKDETGTVPEDTLADKLADLETAVQQERKDNGESEVGVSIKVEGNGTVADAFEDAHEEAAIVGAVLNAEENASEVKLIIAEPKDAHIEDGDFDNFNADASVLFSMTMEGVGDASNLDIPVKITLPVPSNIKDLSKLMIMHYHDGDNVGQRVKFTLFTDENGKAFVSFVLTGFSNFGIGQEVAPVGLSAKLSTNTVTVGADPDDVMISVAAKTAWSDDELAEREIKGGNFTVNDLHVWYGITADATGEEIKLEEALNTVGTYTITPKCEENGNYTVTENGVNTATLEVIEEHFVCQIGDVEYESLSAALTAAKPNETVKLLQDAEESYVVIAPGVTLDLNGKTLEASYVVGLTTAHIIDSMPNRDSNKVLHDGGVLKLGRSSLVLDPNNKQMPVWNGVDGYVFSGISFSNQRLTENAEANTVAVRFTPWFDYVDENYVMSDAAGTGAKAIVRFSWTIMNSDGTVNGKANQDFVFDASQLQYVVQQQGKKALQVTLSNYSTKKDLTMTAMVVSDTKVEIAGKTYTLN